LTFLLDTTPRENISTYDLDFSLQEYKGHIKVPHASGPNKLESIVFSVLFYSIALHAE